VRLVGTVDEEGFAVPATYKTEALLRSIVRGAVVEGVDDMEGGHDVKVVIEERAPEGIAVWARAIDAERDMKEAFIFIIWHPYISFFANIASWNKQLTILYSL
jgi:hypothetical protein